jgi:hypothetical protein
MLPFGVTIPATVPQTLDILEGLMNYPVVRKSLDRRSIFIRLILILSFYLRMGVKSSQDPPLSPYEDFFSLMRTTDVPVSATFLAQ